MSEAWAALQGHVINSAFPLQRYLTGSEHTAVFLAESRRHKLPQVAIKLVRAIPARADAQLSRWLTADGLAHPHLLRLFEAGRCQLGGLQYLYAVMEYADQNLAQLLDHRALTEDEAREMLVPTLSALTFLHERKYVHGQLKPSNILVVGDQLKLASDTIRRAGEASESDKVMTVYDPPEGRGGSYWPAGDVWALGVALCEALTRNRPVGLHDGGRPVAFPRDFPNAFREIVGRCLSRRPHDRPSVAEIEAWLRGKPAAPAQAVASDTAPAKSGAREVSDAAPKVVTPQVPPPTTQAPTRNVATAVTETPAPEAPQASPRVAASETQPMSSKAAPRDARESVAPTAAAPQPTLTSSQPPVMTATATQRNGKSPSRRRTVIVTFAAAAALALIWSGARMMRTHQAPPSAPTADIVGDTRAEVSTPSEPASEAMPVSPSEQPIPTTSTRSSASVIDTPAEPETGLSVPGVHEVLPDVPRRARQTIRGHVKVSVRLIVDPDGTVFAAFVDDAGPSRYFARLAIDAAKKWTFAAAETDGQRLIQLRFDFTRDGTIARAIPLK